MKSSRFNTEWNSAEELIAWAEEHAKTRPEEFRKGQYIYTELYPEFRKVIESCPSLGELDCFYDDDLLEDFLEELFEMSEIHDDMAVEPDREEISREDVYILIADSAMRKMGFLFPNADSEEYDPVADYTYTDDSGREYRRWDVPVFIILSGIAAFFPREVIFDRCRSQMAVHDYVPEEETLRRIYDTAEKECMDEVNAIIETDRLFDADENPIEILGIIKNMLF